MTIVCQDSNMKFVGDDRDCDEYPTVFLATLAIGIRIGIYLVFFVFHNDLQRFF